MELLAGSRKRGDIRMIRTAIANGWNIPADVMNELPETMANLTRDADARTQVAAARVLVAMNAQNQKQSPALVAHAHVHKHEIGGETFEQRKERIAQRIAQLGDD